MSTRSFISVKTDIGYRAIYCHSDGYIGGVGKTLVDYHDTAEKVAALIAAGDLYSLGVTLAPGYSVSLIRDRGEEAEQVSAIDYPSLGDMIDDARHADAEYLYVFENDVWSYLCPRRDETLLQEVPK